MGVNTTGWTYGEVSFLIYLLISPESLLIKKCGIEKN
jgi:hypothetical protein